MRDAAPPWACPNCRQPSGNAFLTTTTKDRPKIVLVRVRCSDCNHEWEIEHDPDPDARATAARADEAFPGRVIEDQRRH